MSNLALVVYEILARKHDEFQSSIRRFVYRAERVEVERLGEDYLQLNMYEYGLKTPIPARRMSDGTLRFIALLATLMQEQAPSLVCIEEPELGLHPDAISLLARMLIRASRQTQLIVTTHSETFLNACTRKLDSVLVCEHDGGTKLSGLKASRLTDWLGKYRLGEIWRMGALGGNP